MNDFVKFSLTGDQPHIWLNNPCLSFNTLISNDGEVIEHRADIREMTVVIKPTGYTEVSGSLQKFYTGGSNATDFSGAAVALSIEELAELLRFKPKAAPLRNFEYGLNIALPIPAKELLKRAIIYQNKEFTNRQTFKGKGYQLEAEQQRCLFKSYDKAAESHCAEHLLRVENRVKKMIHLAPLNIRTLADLTRPDSLAPLGNLLVKQWNDILFHDPTIDLSALPKPRRDLLTKGQNLSYWQSLNSESFRKQRKQFRQWTALHSTNNLAAFVEAEIAAKWERLLVAGA